MSRSLSFGDDPDAYDRARPPYPDELFDKLLADNPRSVADIGCGTGIAARLMAARGVQVIGVEPDPRMAAVARRHGIEVIEATFENWEPTGRFDLITAAQSWHWVDQERGPTKAADLLNPGGRFAAFWNSYEHESDVLAALTAAYELHAPGSLNFCLCLGRFRADDPRMDDMFAQALAATRRFGSIERQTFPWTRRYTAASWIDELGTHSDHHALSPETRGALFDAITVALDDFGGELTVQMHTGLVTATLG